MTKSVERFESNRLIERLSLDGESVIQVVDDRRITLEYYKNGVLHHLAPLSLMAAAIRAHRDSFADNARVSRDHPVYAEIERLFAKQIFLLRYEFTMDPDQNVGDLLEDALAGLKEYGAINLDASGIGIANKAYVVEMAELTRNLLESVDITLRGAVALKNKDLDLRSMPRALAELGQKMITLREIKRPEALSLVNLKNTVRALREEGVVNFKTDGTGIALDEATLNEHAEDIRGLLK